MHCPCCSGSSYEECCALFHRGQGAPSPVALMRSRYSAYALNLPTYIIETTHPGSPQFKEDRTLWEQEISSFCDETTFRKLEIHFDAMKETTGIVVFTAHLEKNGADVSFTEKSYFAQLHGRWFYRSGHMLEGKSPHWMTHQPCNILPLAYYGDPILRKVAEPLGEITPDLKELVRQMIETMDATDGIGLAAPQIHHSVRLFVIRTPIERKGKELDFAGPKIFINPEILETGSDTWSVSEGCLSIPTLQGMVERPKEITVVYTDLEGKRHRERVFGWQARIIQHENDHLNGILFIDHLCEKEKKLLEEPLQRLETRIHQY